MSEHITVYGEPFYPENISIKRRETVSANTAVLDAQCSQPLTVKITTLI